MPRLITKREKTILYLTICVIALAVGFNFLILPVMVKYDSLNKEIKVNLTKLKKYRRLLSEKDSIHGRYNDFASALKISGTEKDAQVAALGSLEEMAKNANIRIIDIRPETTFGEKSSSKETLIEVKTEGSMEAYIKFIYEMENSLSLLRIEQFQLTAKASKENLEGLFTIAQPAILN